MRSLLRVALFSALATSPPPTATDAAGHVAHSVASAVMLVILGGLGSVGWWLYNTATDWFWRSFLVTIS